MPLMTRIYRDGEPLPINWGGFHVACMVMAAAWDSGEGPWEENVPPTKQRKRTSKTSRWRTVKLDYPTQPCPVTPDDVWKLMDYYVIGMTPMNSGGYTLKGTHRFLDVTDGEILELLPGDVLKAWRA